MIQKPVGSTLALDLTDYNNTLDLLEHPKSWAARTLRSQYKEEHPASVLRWKLLEPAHRASFDYARRAQAVSLVRALLIEETALLLPKEVKAGLNAFCLALEKVEL